MGTEGVIASHKSETGQLRRKGKVSGSKEERAASTVSTASIVYTNEFHSCGSAFL